LEKNRLKFWLKWLVIRLDILHIYFFNIWNQKVWRNMFTWICFGSFYRILCLQSRKGILIQNRSNVTLLFCPIASLFYGHQFSEFWYVVKPSTKSRFRFELLVLRFLVTYEKCLGLKMIYKTHSVWWQSSFLIMEINLM